MAVKFKTGRHIDPSGFGLAVIDVPEITPEKNISLIDTSYLWEENVANVDNATIESYVDSGGHLQKMTVTDFVVTNITTEAQNDKESKPLFYRHFCRFHHYSYGEDPGKQVYITDHNENILKGINYRVRAVRVAENIYQIDVLTDFTNSKYVIYKVKYNRCLSDGSEIYPSWVETLNAEPYFNEGNPLVNIDEYSIYGPDADGLYSAVVPPIPVLSELTNVVGLSFQNSPTTVKEYVTNTADYPSGLTVKYTLKSTGPTTYTIRRNKNRETGVTDNYYLQSSSSDSWAAVAANFDIGDEITGVPGVYIKVHGDTYLSTNDEASFNASRSYYYLKPKAYSAIYLSKPKNVTPEDDWYIRVKDGRFRRRMDDSGNPVPSGQGTLWEYAIPEYYSQLWNLTYGPPYKDAIGEKAEILNKQTIQLENTPLYIEPSSVLYNSDAPGFPSPGYMSVTVNDELVPATSILDWDIYNGTVKLAQILDSRDYVYATYVYEENFYEYTGFYGSGDIYTDTAPFPWFDLDLNPIPGHNYGLYASGSVAHIYARPYMNVDDKTVIATDALYHNFTGEPSGVLDFKLGTLQLGASSRPSDVDITDIRLRGGGLNKRGEEKLEKVHDVQPESKFFWDVGYFDGQAIPSNGALVIELPNTLLKSNNGPFEEDEIRKRVTKHMALGEYPIIRFVDPSYTVIEAQDKKTYAGVGIYKFRYVGAVNTSAYITLSGNRFKITNDALGRLVWDSDNTHNVKYIYEEVDESYNFLIGTTEYTVTFDGIGSLKFMVEIVQE